MIPHLESAPTSELSARLLVISKEIAALKREYDKIEDELEARNVANVLGWTKPSRCIQCHAPLGDIHREGCDFENYIVYEEQCRNH